MKKLELRASTLQQFAALGSLILMMILFSILSPYFLNFDNLITVIKQTSVVGIIAIGVTLVIVTGGIDLSLGSVVPFRGGRRIRSRQRSFKLRRHSDRCLDRTALRSHLGGHRSVSGTSGVHCDPRNDDERPGNVSGPYPRPARIYSKQQDLQPDSQLQPVQIHPFAGHLLRGDALLTHFLLKRTSTGRYLFATGSNEEAARLSGINVRLVKLFSYGFCGFMCGLSGVILLARLNSAQPAIGSGYELDAIAAVVIGGTSLSGGVGQISGTIIGVLIMSTMKNGLNLMHVSQFWQQVIIGGVVILAVYIDIKRREAQRL